MFHEFYPDAKHYIQQFSANGGSQRVRSYWSLACDAIIRILRFTPKNLHESEALNKCELGINAKLFRDGKLVFCKNCSDFQQCKANDQIFDVLKD